MQRMNPLSLDCEAKMLHRQPNPFLDLYFGLKKQTLEILNKNHRFGKKVTGPDSQELLSCRHPISILCRPI